MTNEHMIFGPADPTGDDHFEIIADRREPRQSLYTVMREGKIVEIFHTRAEAVAFIEQTTGKDFESDD